MNKNLLKLLWLMPLFLSLLLVTSCSSDDNEPLQASSNGSFPRLRTSGEAPGSTTTQNYEWPIRCPNCQALMGYAKITVNWSLDFAKGRPVAKYTCSGGKFNHTKCNITNTSPVLINPTVFAENILVTHLSKTFTSLVTFRIYHNGGMHLWERTVSASAYISGNYIDARPIIGI